MHFPQWWERQDLPVTCLCILMIVNQLKKKYSVPTSSVLWVLYLRLPTVLFKKNVSVKKNVSGRHLESSYHQHQLIPSVSTGSTTTTGTSRALPFKCFSSCIPYTKCIENFIYRVVPCSNDQVVCFIKDSLVEHNHCCVPQWETWLVSREKSWQDSDFGGLRFEGCFYM